MTEGRAVGSAEAGAAGDSAARKRCRACWQEMPVQANKCTQCGSIQNWQRYLSFSGTVLGLLVALVSVLTFAVPIWSRLFIPKVARPNAVLVEVDDNGRSTFAVSNGGTAPAAVEQIIVGRGGDVAMFDLSGLSAEGRVVQPGDVKIFNVHLHVTNDAEDLWHLVRMFRSDAKCPTMVGVITPSGSRDSARVVTTTAGIERTDEQGCEFKLRKLFVTTLVRLGKDPAFAEPLCKVAAAHPADPANPQVSPRCRAIAAGRGGT